MRLTKTAISVLALASGMALTALYPTSAFATLPALLEDYGDGGRHFDKIEIGDMLVYFHQRTIGEATVEKDYIVYQLDKDTGKFLARKSHWRKDLPAVLRSARVLREQAEAMVEGEVQFSSLYIISPESDAFPLNATPENPCWAVRSVGEHGEYVVTIIDAVEGVILGKGVPPPYTAFSLTGPQYFEPCDGAWSSWSQSAKSWFNAMGYSTEEVEWPTKAKVQSHIQSTQTAMFYELAHGGSTYFTSGCVAGDYSEYTTAAEIEAWMVGYEKMPFAFIGSCGGMCSTGDGTFAYEFRKGSPHNATVVGYCGMAEPQCEDCWAYSIDWQDALFYYMSLGWAVNDAFDQAYVDYPVCASGNCMRFVGDESFAVVPVVPRVTGHDVPDPPTEPEGESGYDKIRYISFVPGNPGIQTALRVTLTTMPPPYAGFSGQKMWIGAPVTKCENAGIIEPPCPPVPGLPPDFQSANLQCTPNCMDYGSVGALHVADDEIIPGAVYTVQAIDCSTDFGNEANYSAPLTINTSKWGDLVKDCSTTPCGPPDGIANVTTDVTAVLDKYKNLPGAVKKSRADLEWNVPDWLTNISDVTFCLDAFLGATYPPTGWAGPQGCP